MRILVLITLFAVTAIAQTPAVVKPVTLPAPSAQQQTALREASADYSTALTKAETSKQHLLAVLYSVMAELGLKPSEYTFNQNPQTGEFTFLKIEPAPTVVPKKE